MTDEEKKFAAYEYLPNEKGNIVPVLHDWCEDAIGYNENYYYEGQATIEGQVYDKWRKIELDADDDNDFGWDTPGKAYYYTNVIVEGGGSVSSNINFPAWEIKYSLDNDKSRFLWAQGGYWITTDMYLGRVYVLDEKITVEDQEFFKTTQGDILSIAAKPKTNQELYYYDGETAITFEEDGDAIEDWGEETEGKGVIYYMKDEYNNECHYDFKNIQFDREGTYYYTFSLIDDNSIKDYSTQQNKTYKTHNNKIKPYCLSNGICKLPSNVFMSLGNNCHSNTLGNNCYSNTFGNNCSSNMFGNNCYSNTFGNDCYSNIFGNSCSSNTLGNNCYSNMFGNGCWSNTFGNNCYSNTFGNECAGNTFGNDCRANIVDSNVSSTVPLSTTSGYMCGVHIHYGVTGQFTVVRGANYTQDVRKSGSQEILLD